jgi:hypothetical protein
MDDVQFKFVMENDASVEDLERLRDEKLARSNNENEEAKKAKEEAEKPNEPATDEATENNNEENNSDKTE